MPVQLIFCAILRVKNEINVFIYRRFKYTIVIIITKIFVYMKMGKIFFFPFSVDAATQMGELLSWRKCAIYNHCRLHLDLIDHDKRLSK